MRMGYDYDMIATAMTIQIMGQVVIITIVVTTISIATII